MRTLPLRAALKSGALITAANWPVILIDFTIESIYKLALTIPVIGGALAVAAIVGTDMGTMFQEGVRAAAESIVGSLYTAPVALVSFLIALAVTALGGALLMYAVKIGTLAVLIGAERRAPDIHAHPVSQELMVRAGGYSLQGVYDGIRRFGRRAVVLALGFGLADLFLGLLYLLVMGYGLSLAMRLTWLPAWPLLVIMATTAGVVAIVGTNLAFDLLRVIVVTDDCSIPTAFRRLMRFAIEDSRQVVGIFSVIGGVMVVATAASILAAAGLAAVAWVPLLGLIVVPLQAAAWIVRGLIFQYLSLASLVAYETQYRRFSDTRWPVTASRPERVARVP